MSDRHAEEQRDALRRLVERRSPDQGFVVRRLTRRGYRRSAELAAGVISGAVDGPSQRLSYPAGDGTTIEIRVLGIHALNDQSVLE